MPRALAIALCCSSCLGSTTMTSVQRALLAPMPVTPALAFENDRSGQVALSGAFRLLDVQSGITPSGVGMPLVQGSLVPMIRTSKRVSLGGAVHYVAPEGAQYRNAASGGVAPTSPGLGFVMATHINAFEHGVFGLDFALQLSIHAAPVGTGPASGPLGTTSNTGPTSQSSSAIAGGAATIVPRFSGRFGTAFIAGTFQTNADIEARGVRTVTSGQVVTDDVGGLRAVLAVLTLGYSFTASNGLGFSVLASVPLGASNFGYTPFITGAVHWAFGRIAEPPRVPVRAVPAPPVSPTPPSPYPSL